VKADKRAFLAKMRSVRGYLGEIAGAADALFPFEPVDAAVAGTDSAAFEDLECFLYFSREEPFAESA
jgi:hypothetical protein